jgi:prophage antirepressor-like protein
MHIERRSPMTKSTEVREFSFDGQRMRGIVDEQGYPMVFAVDAARILGYEDENGAILQQCRRDIKHSTTLIDGKARDMQLICEPDLYRLIVASPHLSAPRFEQWVYEKMLPTLRQNNLKAWPSAAGTDSGAREASRRRKAASIIAADLRVHRLFRKTDAKSAEQAMHNAWAATGIDYSEYLPEAGSEYAGFADQIKVFVAELCTLGPIYQVSKKELYDAYCDKIRGRDRLGRNKFYEMLTETIPQVKTSRLCEGDQRLGIFTGIGLKQPNPNADSDNPKQSSLFKTNVNTKPV